MDDFDQEFLEQEEIKRNRLPPSKSESRYLQPTFSSSLPGYALGEEERVRNSYRTGSFLTLKKLPAKLKPGEIQRSKQQTTKENFGSIGENEFSVRNMRCQAKAKRSQLFKTIPYMTTDYDKFQTLNRLGVEDRRMEIESQSRKPFLPSSCVYKDKGQDIFEDLAYKYPYMGPSTGLPRLESMLRQDDHISNQTKEHMQKQFSLSQEILEGPNDSPKQVKLMPQFTVAGGGENKDRISNNPKEWIQKIYVELRRDWPHIRFKLKFSQSDELVIQFDVGAELPFDSDQTNASDFEPLGTLPTTTMTTTNTMIKNEVPFEALYDQGIDISRIDGFDNLFLKSDSGTTQYPTGQPRKHFDFTNIQTPKLPPNNALQKYMHHLLAHGMAAKLSLRKRGDRWGVMELGRFKRSTSTSEQSNEEEQVPLLTYSFYAPWVNTASWDTKKSFATAQRKLAKSINDLKSYDDTRRQQQTEVDVLGVTLKAMIHEQRPQARDAAAVAGEENDDIGNLEKKMKEQVHQTQQRSCLQRLEAIARAELPVPIDPMKQELEDRMQKVRDRLYFNHIEVDIEAIKQDVAFSNQRASLSSKRSTKLFPSKGADFHEESLPGQGFPRWHTPIN